MFCPLKLQNTKYALFVQGSICRDLRAFWGDQPDQKVLVGGPQSISRTGPPNIHAGRPLADSRLFRQRRRKLGCGGRPFSSTQGHLIGSCHPIDIMHNTLILTLKLMLMLILILKLILILILILMLILILKLMLMLILILLTCSLSSTQGHLLRRLLPSH